MSESPLLQNVCWPEVGIYKRKQENTLSTRKATKKEERKHALDQKSDQEKTITVKKKKKENTLLTKKATKKKIKTFFLFFLLSCFLL